MNDRTMRRLIKLAQDYIDKCPEESSKKHVSFLMRGSAILAVGWNHKGKKRKIHRNNTKRRISPKYHRFADIHSEEHVFRRLLPEDRKLRGLYVVNISLSPAKMQPRMARPCESCQEFLVGMGISKVFYTTGLGESWSGMRLH